MAMLVSASAHAQTITITIISDPAGVALAGSGTNAASFAMGTVSRTGGFVPVGITMSTTSSNWTLSTPFDVYVVESQSQGNGNSSYTLQAMLSVADAVRVWKVDSVALNAVTASTISINDSYDTVTSHMLSITIPDNAPAGAFSNTISLTAISN
jgi:hypothetical protein